MNPPDSSFLSRWSRRKAQLREGVPLAEVAPQAPPKPAAAAAAASAPVAGPAAPAAPPQPALVATPPAAVLPAPTLSDVAALSPQSDFTRFVAQGVTPEVKNAALKTLFTDPHFNLMDRLDTYIDDYGKPDPLPAGMLRKMLQSQALGLFDDEKTADAASAAADARLDAPSRNEPAAGGPSAAPDA